MRPNLQNLLEQLKNDKTLSVQVAAQAQKAANFIETAGEAQRLMLLGSKNSGKTLANSGLLQYS
jgi:hypothetical protein